MSLSLMLLAGPVEQAGRTADTLFGTFMGPVMVLILLLALVALLRTGARRYLKVPPEQALVLYGGGRTRIVTGGAVFVVPLLKDFYYLDLTAFQVALELNDVPNQDRIPITVHANATCHISNKEDLLQVAAQRFGRLGGIEGRPRMIETIKNALEGHLRIIIGQMDMDTILSKRDEFNRKVSSEAETELHRLGCEIAILNIQKVIDGHGYIEALGKPKSAQVKADAAIKEAEATRQQTIMTSNADREAQTLKAQNDAQIALAQRDLNKQRADYEAEVSAAKARSAQAGPLADAEAQKAVVVAQVAVREQQTLAEIKLQDAVAKKTEAELNATILKQAQAEKQRLSTEAEGAANARNIKAAGEAQAIKVEADAKAEQTRKVGTAEADVIKIKGFAGANAEQARLEAEAKGREAQAAAEKALLLAQAEGKKAEAEAVERLLLAQATGARELIAAYGGMSEDQRRLFVTKMYVENAPAIIEALGRAGQAVMEEISKVAYASLSSIDSVSIYDSGAGNGKSAAERWAAIGPDALFETLMNLKRSGLLPVVVEGLRKLGIDASPLMPPVVEPPRQAADEPGA
ncbi:MAG: flotillin family protein [Betaproteobacteria bacterium]